MKKDYNFYRFYKGESGNPFDHDSQNTQYMFWFYESIFDRNFQENESSDWHEFFTVHDLGNRFMKILSSEDYNKPGRDKKKQIFELWLDYLFTFKLYQEYGGENTLKNAYFAF